MIDAGKLAMNKKVTATVLLLALFLATVGATYMMPVHRWADSSTYFMQIQSIAGDLDIHYEQKDILRTLENRVDDLPAGLYLIKDAEGQYTYGKEFSYALFASPFYALLGFQGILVFNGLMFFGMIFMGYLYLGKTNPKPVALFVSTLFFFLSTATLYLFWVHVEIYNMFLIALAVFVWLEYTGRHDWRYLAAASFVFGLATVAKAPNAIFFLPFFVYELYNRRWKNFLVAAIGMAVPVLLFYGFFYWNAGVLSFYGGNRLYYSGIYPFTGDYNATNEAGRATFSLNGQSGGLINVDNLMIVPYNMVYYLIGKFSGLLWYFPFAAFAAVAYIAGLARGRGKDQSKDNVIGNAAKLCIAAGIVLYILEFTTVIGNNYLGGTHAIGNRYFYIYPAFLFLLGRVDWKTVAVFLLLPLITLTPMILHPIGTSVTPDAHTFNFPYTIFPLEDSQVGNLPVYTNQRILDGMRVFSLCPVPESDIRNFAVYNDGIDLYVHSRQQAGRLGIGLISLDGNATVRLAQGGDGPVMEIEKDHCTFVNVTGLKAEYADGYRHLYRWDVSTDSPLWITVINETHPAAGDIILIRNWYYEERYDDVATRWISNNATFLANAGGGNDPALSFRVKSFLRPRTLEVYVNGELVHQATVSGWTNVTCRAPWKPGYNVVTLVSAEGTDNPAHVPVLNSSEDRELSFCIQNITISSG
ncbi:MAG: hypothetical protein A4E28_03129 [Methanocella sp. PtaU1.Bin125]|nr:MAG: hypothetical protein A4E28_03129 [Methanocella sp. PtaU1.Bin125]